MTTIPTNGPPGANGLDAASRGDGASPLGKGIQAGQGPGLAPPGHASAAVGPPHLAQLAGGAHVAAAGAAAFRVAMSRHLPEAILHGMLTAAQGPAQLLSVMRSAAFTRRPTAAHVHDAITIVTPKLMVSFRSDPDGV